MISVIVFPLAEVPDISSMILSEINFLELIKAIYLKKIQV